MDKFFVRLSLREEIKKYIIYSHHVTLSLDNEPFVIRGTIINVLFNRRQLSRGPIRWTAIS